MDDLEAFVALGYWTIVFQGQIALTRQEARADDEYAVLFLETTADPARKHRDRP